MAPIRRRAPGLLLRGAIWHIDKVIYGRLTNLLVDFWTPLLAHARAVNPRRLTIAEQDDWQQFGDDLQRRGGVDLVYAFCCAPHWFR